MDWTSASTNWIGLALERNPIVKVLMVVGIARGWNWVVSLAMYCSRICQFLSISQVSSVSFSSVQFHTGIAKLRSNLLTHELRDIPIHLPKFSLAGNYYGGSFVWVRGPIPPWFSCNSSGEGISFEFDKSINTDRFCHLLSDPLDGFSSVIDLRFSQNQNRLKFSESGACSIRFWLRPLTFFCKTIDRLIDWSEINKLLNSSFGVKSRWKLIDSSSQWCWLWISLQMSNTNRLLIRYQFSMVKSYITNSISWSIPIGNVG